MQVPALRRVGGAGDVDALHPGVRFVLQSKLLSELPTFLPGAQQCQAGTELSCDSPLGCPHLGAWGCSAAGLWQRCLPGAPQDPVSPLCQHHKAETLVIPASPRGIPVGSPTQDSRQAQPTSTLAWEPDPSGAQMDGQCHPGFVPGPVSHMALPKHHAGFEPKWTGSKAVNLKLCFIPHWLTQHRGLRVC